MPNSQADSVSYYTRDSEATDFTEQSTPQLLERRGRSTRRTKQIKEFLCSFQGLLITCGVILIIKYLPSFIHWIHPHYWDAPKTWDSCQNIIGQHWTYMGSPCVGYDDALCTYSANALFSWCSGRYYSTGVGSGGKWKKFAVGGVLSPIWTVGDTCEELGFKDWQNVCQDGNSSVECKLNQLCGFLSCSSGQSYTYNPQDGSYVRFGN